MALRTWLGCSAPLAHDDPPETQTSSLPQRDQELLALDARDAQVQVAREHRRPPAGTVRWAPVDGIEQPVAQPVAERRHPRPRRGRARPPPGAAPWPAPLRPPRPGCHCAARAPVPRRTGAGSSTTRPAMASAPTPTGPPTLCALSETMSAPAVAIGQVDVGRGLHGVGEHVRVGSAAVDRLYEVGQRLDHARLVVGRHDGDTRDARRERAGQRLGVDDAGGVDGELARIEAGLGGGAGRLAHGGVLDGGREEHRLTPVLAGRLGGPQKSQIGRLGATGGEDDLAGVAAEEGGHLVAGLLEQAAGPLRRGVAAGGIAEDARRDDRGHGGRHLGPQRRGGGVVEIGQARQAAT